MKTPTHHPDRWSLTAYFTQFGADDYLAFKSALGADIEAFLLSVREPGSVSAECICAYESLSVRFGHLSSFLGCLASDDATNDAVRADEAWLATLSAELTKISAIVEGALAELDEDAAAALIADPALHGAEFAVRRMRESGRHLMPSDQEALAADLNVDGLHAWGRLYDTLSGRLSFPMTFPDGHQESVPMARRRALMADPDRTTREAAFRDGQVPWETHADTFAAALNGISGARLNLMKRRGRGHFLDEPLFDGGLTRPTLDALMQALRENIEIPRMALRSAAKFQKAPLHFFDLEAPQIPAPSDLKVTWDDACEILHRAFHASYPRLGEFFDSMLDQRWIEAQPRANKRPGAFCTGSGVIHQPRVFMTHHGTINDVVTLAHEVGHAWHFEVLKNHRPLATNPPMTLAETASNFGEMILLDGLERDPASSPGLRAYLLDQQMNRAHAYLINIPMRYSFEHAFYDQRQKGELSAPALRGTMEAAQRDWYGDTLAEDGLDPMFWASKLHFFITGTSFYNFPYVFGYLLSQGLFARLQVDGTKFLTDYERFLEQTGSADCETVVRETLGADITKTEFWAQAIRSLQPAVQAYASLQQ